MRTHPGTLPLPEQNNGAATGEFCLANARLVLEDQVMTGALHVAHGRIVGIVEGDAVPAGALDCDGDHILPGLVELHTDNLERHLEPRPKVRVPHVSAILAHDGELASNGITTVFDALRAGSITRSDDSYERYARLAATEILALSAANALRVRHQIHLRAEICSETLLDELAEFGPDDSVGLVSLMDHTPGQRQFRDMDQMRTYYTGKSIFTEHDFDQLVAERTALGARVRAAHESGALAEAARLGATLASHDDTTREQVARSALQGVRLAEFPTTFEAAEASRAAGIHVVMGAPNLVRGGSHSGNVSTGALAEAGLLDILSSDFAPSLLILSALRLAAIWGDLPRAVRTVTAAPADATGLADRGRLKEGCLADMLRLRMLGDAPVIRAVWCGGRRVG